MKNLVINFRGKEYLLIGDMETGGPIATREAYAAFECGYAHLYEDGVIKRFNQEIGTREDITVIGEEDDVLASKGAPTKNVLLAILNPLAWADAAFLAADPARDPIHEPGDE